MTGSNISGNKAALSAPSRTRDGLSRRLFSRLACVAAASLAFFALYAGLTRASASVSAVLPVKVSLLRAIDLNVQAELNFGTLVLTVDAEGRARLDPQSSQLFLDDFSGLAVAQGDPQVGLLELRGAGVPIVLSVEDETVTLTNGISTIDVTNFNLMTADGGTVVTLEPLNEFDPLLVPVGATLETSQGQMSGIYTGFNRVFASYQ